MLVILGVLHKLQSCSEYVILNEFSVLFKMLRLRPQPGLSLVSRSVDLNVILEFVSDQYKADVAVVLLHFTNGFMCAANSAPDLIYVIPLIHILKGSVKPFDFPALKSDAIIWTDESIRLFKWRSFNFSR